MSLAADILSGNRRAVARLLRAVDDELPVAETALRELFPHTGRARIVGVTGTPGAGKSTLCDLLVKAWRKQGRKVGVLAIDPTSPFTGGAILGDRIRMQDHALDEGVFIRSLATRGNLGGLSRATFDSARVLDASGCDIVLIETVGVGQDEVEIAQLAHTTVLVTVPGLGDDVQAIKAGILEIADVFVVNKADREGADRTVRDLRMMLDLQRSADIAKGWEPPVLSCVATTGQGVDVVVHNIDRHLAFIDNSGERLRRDTARARTEFLNRLHAQLTGRALAYLSSGGESLDAIVDRIARRDLDPYAAVDRIASAVLRPVSAAPAPPAAEIANELTLATTQLSARLAELGLRPDGPFQRPDLIARALTHSSYAAERGGSSDNSNERLEMLGDAALGFAVADLLFQLFPHEQEGGLTRLRASLVDETMLAKKAREIDLGSLLAMGRGEAKSGGRHRDAALADGLEAVFGAIYLSEGFSAVASLTEKLFRLDALDRLSQGSQPADFKTQLQERAQRTLKIHPNYRVVASEGPPHQLTFQIEVKIGTIIGGIGEGRSKKIAEQQAARATLDRWADVEAEYVAHSDSAKQ